MKALLIGNWKMYPATYKETLPIIAATKKASLKAKDVSLVLMPPAVYLRESSKGKSIRIAWGAQHVRTEATGAFTGELSMYQAKDAGASFVLMGHAERRELGETDADVRAKLLRALELHMTAIVCIGEKSRDNAADGAHFEVVRGQLRAIFSGVPVAALKKIHVVYEPRWVIGGSVSMTPHDMHEMAVLIRKTLVDTHGETALQTSIIYGGSINEGNAVAMLEGGDVQGLLVGHASIEPQRFSEIIRLVQNA